MTDDERRTTNADGLSTPTTGDVFHAALCDSAWEAIVTPAAWRRRSPACIRRLHLTERSCGDYVE
ncbi:MAG: hypothetical protein AVDCRST_MAG26-2568 [uncultured Chloroflexia bacterium]|uniref:Uncharacterized protein n=1 Tax=uncultured Chloroflexia bacterium TaxID=1672391 RepID=A0A6J4J3J8_9CHLR|nr:MAG: hypothetical protein AVDCRST_MAG26-2568 [uncultured Chloroflexia bacterium]